MKQVNNSILMSNAIFDLKKYGYSDVYASLSAKEANNVISSLKREFPNVKLDQKTFIIYEN